MFCVFLFKCIKFSQSKWKEIKNFSAMNDYILNLKLNKSAKPDTVNKFAFNRKTK